LDSQINEDAFDVDVILVFNRQSNENKINRFNSSTIKKNADRIPNQGFPCFPWFAMDIGPKQ
jgi:hypothetical protein